MRTKNHNMVELTIYGKNRTEHKNTREGCRALIINEGKILLSVEDATGLCMLPGGGVEEGESYPDCCCREILEECGYNIATGDCILKLSEYYFDYLFINYYFVCEIIGEGDRCLTELEMERGLMPKWVDFDEALDLFSRHEEWADLDEDRRGTYEREYTALCEYVSYMAKQNENK